MANGDDFMSDTRSLPPPGGPTASDDLLTGAIDFHHHGYPEISFDQRTRHEDEDELRIARDAGMAGIVLKSHMWPTVGRAWHLNRLVPGIATYPTITLNPIVGGFSPMAVESAALQGAAVMFMPTWGAAHDIERGGMSRHLGHLLKTQVRADAGLRVTDAGGRVKPEVDECLAVAGAHGMAVATAHISPRESIALAARAKDYGIDSVFFQHPDSNSVGASRDEIREMAALGATIEICALGFLPAFQRITPKTAIEIIEESTPEICMLTTDYFFEWVPSGPETLRMLIGVLLGFGVAAKDIRTMVNDVPRRLLGKHLRHLHT
jgi:hypothetical protein